MHDSRPLLYHRHRFPAEIIAEAVWLYSRFMQSFRMVETGWHMRDHRYPQDSARVG